MSSLLLLAWHRYMKSLEEKPIPTKALTSACIASLSDYIAQRLASSAPWNWRRTLAMAFFGLLYTGPANHVWHQFIAQLFGKKQGSTTIVRKVALDQLVFGPLSNVLMMSYIALVVEGRSKAFLQRKLRRDYPSVQLNAWKLWPLASLINYQVVPLQFRVLFANVVSVFWSTFLILKARSAASYIQRLPIKAA